MRKDQTATYFLTSTVEGLTGRAAKKGLLYGLELELEGRGVALEGVPSKNWKRKEDGSLRGENQEYVFAAPCEYPEACARVTKLFEMFKKNGVKLNNSYRTSTHVHLNFSDKTGKQVVIFFLLHTILEELLEYYCGDERKGNLFCLSARDTEALIEKLEECVFLHGNLGQFTNNFAKYSACNLAVLNQFGSIEVRTMRGANKPDEVIEWLDILRQLYEYACNECPNPVRLLENLSHMGQEAFLRQFFDNKTYDALMAAWPAHLDLSRSLYEGVRAIQMLAYKLEDVWNQKVEVPEAKADPFARDLGNVLADGPRVAGIDRVQLPNGRIWNVLSADQTPHGHRQAARLGNVLYDIRFDAHGQCWRVLEDDRPLMWFIYNGREARPWDPCNNEYEAWMDAAEPEEEPDWDMEEGRANE